MASLLMMGTIQLLFRGFGAFLVFWALFLKVTRNVTFGFFFHLHHIISLLLHCAPFNIVMAVCVVAKQRALSIKS